MSTLLDIVYSVFVLFVSIVGIGFVLGATDVASGRSRWQSWLGAVVVAAFLIVMVGTLVM
jgi:hypothetical protein